MSDRLILNEADHTATLDGRAVPRVTSILVAAGYGPPPIAPADLQYYGERGRFVHKALTLDDEGRLNETSLDVQLAPYVAAWRRFRREYAVRGFSLIEEPVFHEDPDFAGRLDCVTDDGRLVEITTTAAPSKAKHLQAIAYWGALRQRQPDLKIERILILSLRPHGYGYAVRRIPASEWLLLWNEWLQLVRRFGEPRKGQSDGNDGSNS